MDLNLNSLTTDVMRSLGFLTRLPISAKWFAQDDGKLSMTCRAFPIAGALATLPALVVLLIANFLQLPPLLNALLVISTHIMTCGALHEDGLADVADGFFGGNSKDQRLEIMKDSRIGTYGALALIVSFSVRTIAVAAILQASVLSAALALIGAAAMSRGALIWHWSELESARLGGTSDSVGTPSEDAATIALSTALAIGLVFALLARGITPTIIAFALTILVTNVFKRLAASKIGGQTGDTLGASAMIAEIAFLIGLASGL